MPNKDPQQRRAYHRNYNSRRYVADQSYKQRKIASSIKRCQALRSWVNEMKSAAGCLNCGEIDPVVLDYHHRDPKTKSFSIWDMVARKMNKDKILTEIDKCDVLCANCHRREEHKLRRRLTVKTCGFDPHNESSTLSASAGLLSSLC